MQVDVIFGIIILIFSVSLHEASHGYMADMLGDRTARIAGRLTLNPLKHLDFFGSFLLPILTYFSGGFIFGWAKPVPYNPYNLRDQKWGEGKVAFAGPASNILVAVFFGMLLRTNLLPETFIAPILLIILTNLILAVFNLVPIPPLDGSKILFSLLPYKYSFVRTFLEKYSLFLILIFIFFLWSIISPLVSMLFYLLTGIPN
jgi:Zn-dependent protease